MAMALASEILLEPGSQLKSLIKDLQRGDAHFQSVLSDIDREEATGRRDLQG